MFVKVSRRARFHLYGHKKVQLSRPLHYYNYIDIKFDESETQNSSDKKMSAMRRPALRKVLFLAAVLLFGGYYLHIALYFNRPWPKPQFPLLPICILANVESVRTARFTASFWPRYPMFFAVWGDRYLETRNMTVQDRIYLIPAQHSTHAEGWAKSFEVAKRSGHRCEYFFTLDDDLEWFFTEIGQRWYSELVTHNKGTIEWKFGPSKYAPVDPDEVSVTNLLTTYLSERHPAVVVFSWPWGDAALDNFMRMNVLHEGKIEQPATAFDNGCLVFHHSIVDFFIPIWLGDEHEPRFITQNSFLSFFVPYIFQQYATRFNGIEFRNPPEVRHPYDSSSDFDKYLSQGSRCPSFGASMSPDKITWEVAKRGRAQYEIDPRFLGNFYHLTRSIITRNPYIRSRYSPQQLTDIDSDLVKHTLTTQWCTAKLD